MVKIIKAAPETIIGLFNHGFTVGATLPVKYKNKAKVKAEAKPKNIPLIEKPP